ncbi:T9SS type A sorting domain-containing protein [Niastella yeongjuensis]|uniref:T9SS type A sorting domain-containing protein n=1 Tax=Niastella yeongjuensis TaxID=354355 RepID=UPI0008D2A84A|nr:T9SS type A sorting domain-containing protein [Niastella yeongjuensis]SEP36124.1 Por secretion system C-terminal sorting domain-containing protein [Niastella yeongjuensis]
MPENKFPNPYRLKMVDLNGYTEYSKIATLKVEERNSLSIYPNPVTEQLFVKGATGGSAFQVKTMSGQVLKQGTIKSTGSIDVSALSKGMYVLTVDGAHYKFIKK